MYFRMRILFIAFILIVSILSMVTLFNYFDSKNKTVTQIEIGLKITSQSLADYIDLWTISKKNALETEAEIITSIDYSRTNDDELQERLKKLTKSLGALQSFIGYEDGRIIFDSGKSVNINYDPRTREWYQKAKTQAKAFVTDMYLGAETKLLMITIMIPLYYHNTNIIEGVLAIDLELTSLFQIFSNIDLNGGNGILLDSNGVVIACSKQELLGKHITLISKVLAKKIQSSDEGIIHYSFEDKDKIFAYKVSKETGWISGIIYDKAQVYAFLNDQTQKSLIMACFMLIFSMSIVIVVIKLLLHPLDCLNQVAKDEIPKKEGILRQ